MPIGLMMSLAQHEKAMETFGRLNDERQEAVLRYVKDSRTGEEAKSRIRNAVDQLEQGNAQFFG
jgi:uncharacterized protein YdeI (YjbR/CyaY-like superfamily)